MDANKYLIHQMMSRLH